MMLEIQARQKWNDTGFKLVAGRMYVFRASGTWNDASIRTGPQGYRSPTFFFRCLERYRRFPKADWFSLIGAIDRDLSTAFLIGLGTDVEAQRSGTLTCFANDLSVMYWNNSGSVELDIR